MLGLLRNSLPLATACMALAAAGQSAPTEHETRGAFLVNIGRLAKVSGVAPRASYAICVYGGAPVRKALESVHAAVLGKPISVREVRRPADVAGCHLLYVGDAAIPVMIRLLEAASAERAIAVGASDDVFQAGGYVALVASGHRITVRIAPAVAEELGVEISSHLLEAAQIVGRAPTRKPSGGDRGKP